MKSKANSGKKGRGGATDLLHPSSFRLQPFCRVGIGNDIHRLAAGRRLILGGVRIPFEKGPEGHSDGDALAHAICDALLGAAALGDIGTHFANCDALLGAAALGDIGTHFPNSSPKWRNASSLLFLEQTRRLLAKAGFAIVNVDATIGLERPRLAPFIPRMRQKLAAALGLKPEQVSVKAKTGEGVDAVGQGEAVRADAMALLSPMRVHSRPVCRKPTACEESPPQVHLC
ncbi:MAG: 2-C-methyl-D-erythritol 2,4-cyclodiphosphate synthase [Acidobacteriia bacterium]|nr:2-C-methyl-D-erythritol 2,4-cyclodiphosphate synthase [Terriglobia bacterium]